MSTFPFARRDPNVDDISSAINSHVTNSRSLFTKLVTTPIVPTSLQQQQQSENEDGFDSPSANTLAYLSSSVANTAARVARLETHQRSLENKSLQLAHQRLATQYSVHNTMHNNATLNREREEQERKMMSEILKPVNNSLEHHDRVLMDVVAIVNRLAHQMDDNNSHHNNNQQQQQQHSANTHNSNNNKQHNNNNTTNDQQQANEIQNDQTNILSPMTRVSDQSKSYYNHRNIHHENNNNNTQSSSSSSSNSSNNTAEGSPEAFLQRPTMMVNSDETSTSFANSTTTTTTTTSTSFGDMNNNNNIPQHLIPSTTVSQAGNNNNNNNNFRLQHHHQSSRSPYHDASPYSRAYRALVASLEIERRHGK